MTRPMPDHRPAVAPLAPSRCGICAEKMRIGQRVDEARAHRAPRRSAAVRPSLSQPEHHLRDASPVSSVGGQQVLHAVGIAHQRSRHQSHGARGRRDHGRAARRQKAMTMPMTNEANRPTSGSMPATTEKAMTSGIRANVPTMPARTSRRALRPPLNHFGAVAQERRKFHAEVRDHGIRARCDDLGGCRCVVRRIGGRIATRVCTGSRRIQVS